MSARSIPPVTDTVPTRRAAEPSASLTRAVCLRIRSIEGAVGRLASHRAKAILFVGAFAFVTSAGLSALVRWPIPLVQDEFSYLLAADTFAHGRLSNPTHPFWVHFETLHVIQRPAYASKYPPGQGLALAAGAVAAGHPVVGVWMSTAVACAAICWMLMGWVKPRWALLGGILAAMHPTILLSSQTYWGGSLAALGGALVVGALRRLMAIPRVRDAWLMGTGATVLANTRPYEGAALCLLAFAALAVRAARKPALLRSLCRPPVLTAFASTAVAILGFAAVYNVQVTGSALRMPYVVHEEAYGMAPVFLWQQPRPEPNYHHESLRKAHLGQKLQDYLEQRSAAGLVRAGSLKLLTLGLTYVPNFALLLPLVSLPWVLKDPWMRLGLVIAVGFTAALLAGTWLLSHYTAPVAGLFFVFEAKALRRLRLWRWRGRHVGLLVSRGCVVLCFVCLVPWIVSLASYDRSEAWMRQIALRDGFSARLGRDGRRHLVLVRYSANHEGDAEWVYNAADIDQAKVVWAREMGATRNRQLIDYFGDRCAWLLEVDAPNPVLVSYPVNEPPSPTPRIGGS